MKGLLTLIFAYRKDASEFTEKEFRRKIMSIDLSKFWLGLDMPTLPTYTETAYPRYNIIESGGDYRIEVAVPGWDKKELEIIQDDTELFLKGKKEQKEGWKRRTNQGLGNFCHKGWIYQEQNRRTTIGG